MWEPPLKDGGKPIKGYIVEKREKGSKRWTKYVAALFCVADFNELFYYFLKNKL